MNELSPLGLGITFSFFAAIVYFGFLRSGLSLAPWVPTKTRDFDRIHKLSQLQPGETFVEAGCGDARVAAYIARNNPDVMVVGIEMSFIMCAVGKIRAFFSRLPNLTVKMGDVLQYDFREVDVVYTYALPETVEGKLMPKVRLELKSGARLVSYAFEIQDTENVTIDKPIGLSPVYIYSKPK